MKKFRILSALFVFGSFMACEQNDAIIDNVYDESGQIGLGFTTTEVSTVCGWSSGSSIGVKVDGGTIRLGVESTVQTTEDRTYNLIGTSSSSGTNGHFTIGNVTIPANTYNGTALIEFFDDGTLIEPSYELVVDIEMPAEYASHTSSSITLKYGEYQLCNDFVLKFNEDDGWAGERTWDVKDSNGDVVADGGPYTDGDVGPYLESFSLEDGSHTLTVYDSYGDGQWNGVVAGSYSLDCGNANVASGGNNWGASESKEFCVNP